MTANRKKEAHQKLLLGGIVVRAGLSTADRAFLLGGLLELARLSPETSEYRRLHYIGEVAFRVTASIGAYHPVADDAG
ncbi:conjugal transfer protein TraD [Brucella pituitosa]|uniref:conjugal transfer protein TraD n=1 Tax=Brucella pituitosa TaxID=571256 RepID=UPI003F4AD08A